METGPKRHAYKGYMIVRYPDPDGFYSIEVPSSRNPEEIHCVIIDHKSVECSCSGFMYRRYCSHVTLAVALIKS